MKNKELWRSVKFTLFSVSAGIIQVVSFTLLNTLVHWPEGSFALMDRFLSWLGVTDLTEYGPNYFIALMLSVLWNFTFNRKFTFKSAANVPVAMLKVFAFYLVFTPLSIWWGVLLTGKYGWNEYLVLALTMVVNFVTEFLYQRFFVFGKTIDTNDLAKKEGSAADQPGC